MPQAAEQPEPGSDAAGIYSVDDAVNHVANMPYEGNEDSELGEEVEEQDSIEDEENEEANEDAGEEDSTDDDQDSDEEEEQPEDSDEEQPDAADEIELPDDDLVVAQDGETKVTLGELREQYQSVITDRDAAQAALTQKSQQVAEEVKKAEKQAETALAHYQMVVGALGQSLQKLDQETDWNVLKTTDPGEFQARLEQRNQLEQQAQSFQQGAEQLLNAAQTQKAEREKGQAKQALDYLKDKVNGWNQDVYEKVASFAEGQGIPAEDFYGIRSGAMIKSLHDLMRVQEARDKALTKVKKKTAPEAKQKAQKRDKRSSSQKKISALEKRAKNGDKAAAVELLMNRPYD